MDMALITNMLFHIVTLGIVFIALLYVVLEVQAQVEQKKIEGTFKVNTNKQPVFKRLPVIAPIYNGLHDKLADKGHEHLTIPITSGILVVSLIPLVVFGFFGQYLLMMVTPFAILKGAQDIIKEITIPKEEVILSQLPRTIDNLIKTAGRHDNIQVALSEASYGLAQPMKGELEEMVRKMNSQDRRSVLEEFSNRYCNAWIRSFVFILSSLVEDAERKTALDNLRTLRNMVDQEQKLTLKSVGEKRSSVMQNYFIVAIALISSIIAMFTGPGRQFYFETAFGLFSLMAGYVVLYITVKINLGMMSKKGGG